MQYNQTFSTGEGLFQTALLRMYEYQVLHRVKESLYYCNEKQITKDIKHYITAVNFETNSPADCFFINNKLFITEEFMESMENRRLPGNVDYGRPKELRSHVLNEYSPPYLQPEMMVEEKDMQQTESGPLHTACSAWTGTGVPPSPCSRPS